MKFRPLALSLALALAFVAGSASAAVDPEEARERVPACSQDVEQSSTAELALPSPASGITNETMPLPGQELEFLGAGPKKIKGCANVGPCNQWDNPHCDYSCIGNDCCRAVELIPNSYCPLICA